ncbi:hypothetical protein [Zoogloea sp.]|uniref:hypothetical protein n=1 Tax=Zoogloea sp. TaxID=49181 RepID=UPI0025CBF6B8|nr:hypothetical protein [Zoogloea sp.]MCK6394552.1 hypothetical protein [Zoogloea sp.]
MAGAGSIGEMVLLIRGALKEHCIDVLEQLDQRIEADEAAFEALADQYQEGLKGLRGQVEQGGAEVTAELDALQSVIDAEANRFFEVIEQVSQASSTFDDVIAQGEQQFSDLQAELLAALDETERLVEDASRVLSEHHDRLAQVTGDLLDTAGQGVDAVVQAIGDFGKARDAVFEELGALMQQVADALGQSDSVLLSDWGSSIEQLGQGADQLFVQDLGSSLRSDADQLTQALGFLQGNADRLSDVFGGDVGDLLNALKEISGLIERIKPLLEQVEMLI